MNGMVTNGFYGNLEVVMNRMASMLLNNKEFCKYIAYVDNDPLYNVDLEKPLELLDKKFFLQSKPSNLQESEGIIVEMIFAGDNPDNRNGGFITDYTIVFNVICHLKTWRMKNGVRPFRIMNIIDSSFNGKYIPEISYSKIIPLGSKEIPFADQWRGYKVAYKLSWNGNSGC